MPPKRMGWREVVAQAVSSSRNAKRASLRPEWRRLTGDRRKVELIAELHGSRGGDGDVAEMLSENSASFVKFMAGDASFLLYCLTACVDTGCALDSPACLRKVPRRKNVTSTVAAIGMKNFRRLMAS